MTIDLTSYKSVQSNLFVRIVVEEYRTSPSGSYTEQILRFSDRNSSFTIEGESYLGVGNLMGISSSNSELLGSSSELTITLSGIPNSSINEIVNSRLKGSKVTIYRAFFDASSGNILAISGNPLGRYSGYINNYSLNEEYDTNTRLSTNTLVIVCNSLIDTLANKIAGRKTNPESQKRFYPSDLSMDRVPTLENATFDFGVKK